jgi:Protein kinase domain
MPPFIELLKRGGKDRPKVDILNKIRASYASEMLASIHDVESAMDLYERVNGMPSTFTKAIVEHQTGTHINGPLMLDTPKLLVGSRSPRGRPIVVKLLILDFDEARPQSVRDADLQSEAKCCVDLELERLHCRVALVPCEVFKLSATPDMVGQTRRCGEFTALLMPRYFGSLVRSPFSFPESVATDGRRLIDALRYMHTRSYVHMDVKGDNVFIDSEGAWFLGDFGSACIVDSPVRSTTDIFYHTSTLGCPARPKFDWFMLLVMLLIELGNRQEWTKKFVERDSHHVSEALVTAEARRVIDNHEYYAQDLRGVIEEALRAYNLDEC